MAKTKQKGATLETPEYEKLTTVEEVETEIEKHKNLLVKQDLVEARMKEEKKEWVSAQNEHLKIVAEERDHEMGVLGALEDRKKQILKIIPIQQKAGGKV